MANRSVRRDASGLELTLVVADKVEFEKAEDMTLEVSFVNTNDGELYRNGAQSVFFEITGGGRTWSTTTCQPDYGGQRPPPTALAIEPGEPNRFVGTYPASPGFRTRDQCRLPPGDYEVAGLVDWCPPETITRPSGGGQACDGATDVPVRSAPVEVRIT